MFQRQEALSNNDLVENLVNSGVISNPAVGEAMRACDRKIFVPDAYKEEALFDAPIHVEDEGFNISAPHMHALCLQELDIREGMSVLDVGSGSGLSTAYCAMMAGSRGSVVGMDLKKTCVSMGQEAIGQLQMDPNSEFVRNAAPCRFVLSDAFIACETDHKGMYDRVHVGGCCPPERVKGLLKFLKPSGGKMVIPVEPSELKLISIKGEEIDEDVVAQVRFTELNVPSEIDVVHAVIKSKKKARLSPPKMQSSYSDDLKSIQLSLKHANFDGTSSSPQDVIGGPPASPRIRDILQALGDTDCLLQGNGWVLKVHSLILKYRCMYFRARSDSGMKDACLLNVQVPDQFSQDAVARFVDYLYHDDTDLNKHNASSVMEVAHFYGVPKLLHQCEIILADALKAACRSERHIKEHSEAAISLLCMSQTLALHYLMAVSMDFIVTNYAHVSRDESFSSLDSHQLSLIAEEACRQLTEVKSILHEAC